MKRVLLMAFLIVFCLGQGCPPASDNAPPAADQNGADDGMNDGDDNDAGEPGADGDNTGNDDQDDDAGTPPEDNPDDTPPPDDTVDDGTGDDTPDDGSGDGDDPASGDDSGDGDNGGTGDDDGTTNPPPTGGGGEDPVTGPCSGVNFAGTWSDGDRLFEIRQSGNTITSHFAEPFVCDHEDDQGTTTTTDEDFTATLAADCTLTGTITVCRFGCTPEADDCALDQNGIATVSFEGEAADAGDTIAIDFTDPLTGDSFSLRYTREP